MEEIWKKIEGYEYRYSVSNLGRIQNILTGKILKSCPNNKGYHLVDLYKDGKKRKFLVQRLVAIHFIPNPDNLPEVNHIKGDKSDNSESNLEWQSRMGNVAHSVKEGLSCKGSTHGGAKLSDADILNIRERSAKGETLKSIAESFNITFGRVGAIVRGESWKHVGGVITKRGLDHRKRTR